MRTSLVTREEMIEAIEQHTACISTRDIPGVIANYFMGSVWETENIVR
ncbi:putative antirepression [Escherichia coli]|nr:hypothetical protein [Escherichia coli]CTV33132.1 putative antirepression [Escherichia coli]CTZ22889.1 putative antirepression [Escherichia coli]CTZ95227.1 putative antirepression [Escherichia coli]